MTFQSIFIILFHIDLIFGVSSGRLSREENENRLNTCGTEMIPTPSSNETAIAINSTSDFLWIAHSKFSNASTVYSAASPISSRHFLTFSNTILDSKRRWLHNGSIYTDYCTGNNRHAEVPDEVVKLLRFTALSCYNSKGSKCKNKTTTAVRAFLPYFCHKYTKHNFPVLFSPMIVEMKDEFKGTPLCLSGTDPLVKVGDQVHAYRFSPGIGFKHSSHIVKYILSHVMGTTNGAKTLYGGPLVKFVNAKPIIVGFIGNYVVLEKTKWDLFFNIKWLAPEICGWAGICERTKTTTPKLTKRSTVTLPTTSRTTTLKTASEARTATVSSRTKTTPKPTKRSTVTLPTTSKTTISKMTSEDRTARKSSGFSKNLKTSSEATTTEVMTSHATSTEAPKTTSESLGAFTTSSRTTTSKMASETRTTFISSDNLKTSTEATTTEVMTSRAASSEAPKTTSKSPEASMTTFKASSSLATIPHSGGSKEISNPKVTTSASSDSPISSKFTTSEESKTTSTIPILKKPTSSEPEYDYEEYEEEQESPMAQELKYEDFLDKSVENDVGRKRIWILLELFCCIIFSWILV
ncbi:hypothetical protein B9Z55_002999 [Caenorhabditis nigoni]|uniref:Peptidase S1 domain-containing protein n=1 Tax=Caenorhabditis nigoni TaxID=1611254 RepID=A0A2G5VND3_9PELO|nr:hypothetical protein B9Z55_002999 [Caenorhabditis nigoni]